MALTVESHTLRVQTGIVPLALIWTSDLPPHEAASEGANIAPWPWQSWDGTRTGLNRDSKYEPEVSTTEF